MSSGSTEPWTRSHGGERIPLQRCLLSLRRSDLQQLNAAVELLNEQTFQAYGNVTKLKVDAGALAVLAGASIDIITHETAVLDLRVLPYNVAKLLRALHSKCPFGEVSPVPEEKDESSSRMGDPWPDTDLPTMAASSSSMAPKSIIRVAANDVPQMTAAIELFSDASQLKTTNQMLLDSKVLGVLSKAFMNVTTRGQAEIDLAKHPYSVGREIKRVYDLCPFGHLTEPVEES